MPYIHVSSVLLCLFAMWMGLSANDAHTEWRLAERNAQALQEDIQTLKMRKASLEAMPPGPIWPSPQALSKYFARMVEAGEVLGAYVRIESRAFASTQAPLVFEPMSAQEVGVQVCRTKLNTTFEGVDSLPLMAMLEDELSDLPVTVTSIIARQNGGDVALSFDVDVFGRAP